MGNNDSSVETFLQWIKASDNIVFFGGAGVSTESGIPDFRSVDGLYNQKYDYPPETILSHTFYRKHPQEFYRFYRDKMLCLDAEPNITHYKLAELEKAGKLKGVVTQNIDVSQSYYPAQHSTSAAGNSSQYAHHNHDNANNAANADTAKRDIHDSASRFLPPGFRTRTPWKMLLSSVAYLFIIWLCLTLEIENTYGAKLWLERIFCLGMFIFAIFCGFNYLNVQNILPLCKSKNRFLHYVGIILLDVAVIFALFVIMFIIESVPFPIK